MLLPLRWWHGGLRCVPWISPSVSPLRSLQDSGPSVAWVVKTDAPMPANIPVHRRHTMLKFDPTTYKYTITNPTDGDRVWAADLKSVGVPLPDDSSSARTGEYAVCSKGGGLYRVQEGRLTARWMPHRNKWVPSYYGILIGARRFFGKCLPSGQPGKVKLESPLWPCRA